jgi:hypothetical protein
MWEFIASAEKRSIKTFRISTVVEDNLLDKENKP